MTTRIEQLDLIARLIVAERLLDHEFYAARRHKPQAGQRTFHFESAAPTGRHAWTAEDERKHPRDQDGTWAEKETPASPVAQSRTNTPSHDETVSQHVQNLHDAMQESLGRGKQFLARHAGKPLWISSGDHVRVSDDRQTIEHTDPEGRWVKADLAQLDHWADKAGLQPFTGPEGILTKQSPTTSQESKDGPARQDQPARSETGKQVDQHRPAPGRQAVAGTQQTGPAGRAAVGEGPAGGEKLTAPPGQDEPSQRPSPVEPGPGAGEQTTYINGDEGRYTGKTETIHGGTFYQVEMLEGPDKGKIKVTQKGPAVALTPDQAATKKAQQDLQAGFRRLRESGKSSQMPKQDQLKGGRADQKPDSEFEPEALQRGIDHEAEHTDDPARAKEIAKDHLIEDPAYYEKLDLMEQDRRPVHVREAQQAIQDLNLSMDSEQQEAMRRVKDVADQHGVSANELWRELMYEPEGMSRDIEAELDRPDDREPQDNEVSDTEEQPASPATPHRPPEPETPEADDSEPPEEYLAHTTPAELKERIQAGDAAAADEVLRRLDEQYPDGSQSPKAPRAQAVKRKLVEDFGEKIGGARKDMARPLGPRSEKKPADDRPGWARRYEVSQITKSSRKEEEGRWAVYDTKHKTWYGQPRQVGIFATEEEAKRAVPMAELARTHRVWKKEDGTFAIVRNVSDRKHPVVRGGFQTQDEAMRYMAAHPEEIIEHQFPRYEQYQYLDRVQRQGGQPRAGNIAPQDFQREFGFRGGEFGNWQSGRDGQTSLNHAYEAFHDLADALGIEPRGLTLNGDLAIAFGARGTGGKDAARAHYEPGARVINLTKMRGAGTLAHEFAHALDNYFARQAKVPGERYGQYEFVTEGLPHRHNLRPEVADAWTNLVKSMMGKEEVRTVDPERIQKQKQYHWDHVKSRIDNLEASIEGDKRYNKRHKAFTPDQQAEWDATKAAILSGQAGEKQFVDGRSRFGGYQTYANLAKLNQLYKAATGRSFHTTTKGSLGQDLYWSIQASLDADKTLGEAQEGKTETKRRATNYYQEARKLDETRASSYYTVPTEMLARAFEAYVYDKLAAENRRSDYLVGKAENKYYKAFDMAPFPEGEERTAINAAFDRLFGAIKSRPRQDDKGQHVELYALSRALYSAYWDRLTAQSV